MCYLQTMFAKVSGIIEEYGDAATLSDNQRNHLHRLKDLRKYLRKRIDTHG
jgi:hypothetical protein